MARKAREKQQGKRGMPTKRSGLKAFGKRGWRNRAWFRDSQTAKLMGRTEVQWVPIYLVTEDMAADDEEKERVRERQRKRERKRKREKERWHPRSLEACNFGNRAAACGKKEKGRGSMCSVIEKISLSLHLFARGNREPVYVLARERMCTKKTFSSTLPRQLRCSTNERKKENCRGNAITQHTRSKIVLQRREASLASR